MLGDHNCCPRFGRPQCLTNAHQFSPFLVLWQVSFEADRTGEASREDILYEHRPGNRDMQEWRGLPRVTKEVCQEAKMLPRLTVSQDHPLFQTGNRGQKLHRNQEVLATGHILILWNFVLFGWLFLCPQNCHKYFGSWTATLSAKHIQASERANRGAEGSLW